MVMVMVIVMVMVMVMVMMMVMVMVMMKVMLSLVVSVYQQNSAERKRRCHTAHGVQPQPSQPPLSVAKHGAPWRYTPAQFGVCCRLKEPTLLCLSMPAPPPQNCCHNGGYMSATFVGGYMSAKTAITPL
jgi:hypothetical protein